jgi:hypothetical protein
MELKKLLQLSKMKQLLHFPSVSFQNHYHSYVTIVSLILQSFTFVSVVCSTHVGNERFIQNVGWKT